jgi:SAM-dependent methyltransferase
MFAYMTLDVVERLKSRRRLAQIMELGRKGRMEYEWFPRSPRAFEYPFVTELLEERLPKHSRVLDAGVYRGPFPHFLSRLGYDVTAIDINPALLPHWALAQIILRDGVKYRLRDAEATRFASGSFDAVTSISVLEHMQQPVRSLREAARLLRPGGLFVVTCDMVVEDVAMSCPHNAFTHTELLELFAQVPELQPIGKVDFNEHDALAFYDWMKTTFPHHNYVGGVAVTEKAL